MSNINIILIVFLVLYFVYKFVRNTKAAAGNAEISTKFLEDNSGKEGVISTDSGLQYKVISKGEGDIHPTATSKVKVHYHGTLINGAVFDSSVAREKPISFGLNQVIKGWTEGVQLMVAGDKFRFYIPSNLAYGKRGMGKIPAGSLLIFDIELIAIN